MRKLIAAVVLILAGFGIACGDNQNPVGPSANPNQNVPEGQKDERTFGIVWSD
jgi:hypothetical protein